MYSNFPKRFKNKKKNYQKTIKKNLSVREIFVILNQTFRITKTKFNNNIFMISKIKIQNKFQKRFYRMIK